MDSSVILHGHLYSSFLTSLNSSKTSVTKFLHILLGFIHSSIPHLAFCFLYFWCCVGFLLGPIFAFLNIACAMSQEIAFGPYSSFNTKNPQLFFSIVRRPQTLNHSKAQFTRLSWGKGFFIAFYRP